MTHSFIKVLQDKGYSYELKEGKLIVTYNGNVDLDGSTVLPNNTVFNNGGWVDLDGSTTLPNNTIFNNQGGVYLLSLTTLPDNTVFNNGGIVYLSSLRPNAINAGKHRRKIHCWRHKTKGLVCRLGCFVGTRDEAIEAIKDKYTDIDARDAYIGKVNEAFADYLSKATNPLTK